MTSLVADYRSSSNSDSDGDIPTDNTTVEAKKTDLKKLPPPPKFGSGLLHVKNSVFTNPFKEAENAKKAILEKHVKMTPTGDALNTTNDKKICWNFIRGSCRFGRNCRFSHDSDVHSKQSKSHSEREPLNSKYVSSTGKQVTPVTSEGAVRNSENPQVTCKKIRLGHSETLTPSKKVMNMHKKQKFNDAFGNSS